MLALRPQFEAFRTDLPAVTDRELLLYEKHFQLLQEWNQKIGLVSRKSIDLAFSIHYADSLFISHLAAPHAKGVVYDLGSGAGFPGIIFAIRHPERPVVLFEKMQKKQKVLSEILSELDLPNCELGGEFPDEPLSGLFLARAVFPRDELFKFFSTRMESESILVTNLGSQSIDLPVPRGFLKLEEKEYKLPLDQGSRRIEILRKVPASLSATPRQVPRGTF